MLLHHELGAINHKRVERLYAEEGLQLPITGLPEVLVMDNGPEFTN